MFAKTFRFPCRAKLSPGGETSHPVWFLQFSIRIHICRVTLERVVMAGGRAKQATQLEDSHGRSGLRPDVAGAYCDNYNLIISCGV